MGEIIDHFSPFGIKSIVITKLDETSQVGGLISNLASRDYPLSYITDGQGVPMDIKSASVFTLLDRIDGLEYEKENLRERFPSGEDLTAAWS